MTFEKDAFLSTQFSRFSNDIGVGRGLVVGQKANGRVFSFRVSDRITAYGFQILPDYKIDAHMKASIDNVSKWLAANGDRYHIDPAVFQTTRLRLFMPSFRGTSGPSAGAAIACACFSHFKKIELRPDIAVTGGLLPDGSLHKIGMLREKLMAAAADQGINTVIIPEANQDDLDYVPGETKERLRILPVRTIDDVLEESRGTVPLRIECRTPSSHLRNIML